MRMIQKLAEMLHVFVSMLLIVLTGPKLPDQVRPRQVESGRASSGRVRGVRSGQVRSGQVRPGQASSGQVRPGQASSGQVSRIIQSVSQSVRSGSVRGRSVSKKIR